MMIEEDNITFNWRRMEMIKILIMRMDKDDDNVKDKTAIN
jgi:hypothetical protein